MGAVEGTVAGVLRHGPAGWTVPRFVGKCRRKVQAATPRLPLGLLEHERLVEHCPGALRWWGAVETIGGCFGAAVNSSSDALREEAGRAMEIGNDGKPVVVARASRHGRLLKHYEAVCAVMRGGTVTSRIRCLWAWADAKAAALAGPNGVWE